MDMVLNNSSNCQTHSDPGFPFDDDRNRINIRTYLDEIASRHPEFADQLKEPPRWGEDFASRSFERENAGSDRGAQEEPRGGASGSDRGESKAKEPRQNLTNFGLRNTVPLGPGAVLERERSQRSMSAPPENRSADKSRRFVSKCEIPVMNEPMQDSAQMRADVGGKGGQDHSAQAKGNNAPNVRVIPIQVEGRDTPLVNTNVDTSTNFGGETYRDASFEGRLPRDFGSYQKHSPRFAHKERAPTPPQYQYAPHFQQYVPPHQHFVPPHQQNFMPQQQFAPHQQQAFAHQEPHSQKPPAAPPTHQHQHQHQHHQQHPHQQHHQQPHQQQQQQPPPPHMPQQHQGPKVPQGNETDVKPTPPKPQDPIEKVQLIQKEVEELMRQVEAFKGNSRTDKQYLMLDELLTRQLLLLDNIETEGKENVRQARKDAIRSIQRCISTLENKVPLLENNEASDETKEIQGEETKAEEAGAAPQAMEVDQTKENTPVETKESQNMEVDEKATKESQEEQQQAQQQQQQQQQQPQQQPQPEPKEESKEKA